MARRGVETLVPDELKPYLKYSVGVHVVAALAFARLLSSASVAAPQIYTIDFVGPSATIQSQSQSSSPPASPSTQIEPSKPPPDAAFDEFGRRKNQKKSFALPRPSVMRGFQAEDKPQQQTESGPTSQAPAAGASAADGGGGSNGSGITTDMPNFPYPWYISQVRSALWNKWSERMPKEQGEAVIVFSILPNGSVVDLRAEESSGSSAFDLTAESAVQDAAPFAPLPREFPEPFLKVHVTLKSQ
jgi:protein TonB